MQFFAHLNDKNRVQFACNIILSVQAGPYLYSKPKDIRPFHAYTHYEVGIMGASCNLDFLEAYKDSDDDWFTYVEVPVELVETLFQHLKHTYGFPTPMTVPLLSAKKTEKKQTIGSAIANKTKQQALLFAMNHTQNETLYELLERKFEETIDFDED